RSPSCAGRASSWTAASCSRASGFPRATPTRSAYRHWPKRASARSYDPVSRTQSAGTRRQLDKKVEPVPLTTDDNHTKNEMCAQKSEGRRLTHVERFVGRLAREGE